MNRIEAREFVARKRQKLGLRSNVHSNAPLLLDSTSTPRHRFGKALRAGLAAANLGRYIPLAISPRGLRLRRRCKSFRALGLGLPLLPARKCFLDHESGGLRYRPPLFFCDGLNLRLHCG